MKSGRWLIGVAITIGLLCPASAREPSSYTDYRIADEDFGAAIPIAPETWVTSGDYPESVVRVNDEGIVGVSFDFTPTGRVINCKVTQSSGSTRLDITPCRLIERRARFRVAETTSGRMKFHFRIPPVVEN